MEIGIEDIPKSLIKEFIADCEREGEQVPEDKKDWMGWFMDWFSSREFGFEDGQILTKAEEYHELRFWISSSESLELDCWGGYEWAFNTIEVGEDVVLAVCGGFNESTKYADISMFVLRDGAKKEFERGGET